MSTTEDYLDSLLANAKKMSGASEDSKPASRTSGKTTNRNTGRTSASSRSTSTKTVRPENSNVRIQKTANPTFNETNRPVSSFSAAEERLNQLLANVNNPASARKNKSSQESVTPVIENVAEKISDVSTSSSTSSEDKLFDEINSQTSNFDTGSADSVSSLNSGDLGLGDLGSGDSGLGDLGSNLAETFANAEEFEAASQNENAQRIQSENLQSENLLNENPLNDSLQNENIQTHNEPSFNASENADSVDTDYSNIENTPAEAGYMAEGNADNEGNVPSLDELIAKYSNDNNENNSEDIEGVLKDTLKSKREDSPFDVSERSDETSPLFNNISDSSLSDVDNLPANANSDDANESVDMDSSDSEESADLFSDSNKMMSLEEIANLISNAGTGFIEENIVPENSSEDTSDVSEDFDPASYSGSLSQEASNHGLNDVAEDVYSDSDLSPVSTDIFGLDKPLETKTLDELVNEERQKLNSVNNENDTSNANDVLTSNVDMQETSDIEPDIKPIILHKDDIDANNNSDVSTDENFKSDIDKALDTIIPEIPIENSSTSNDDYIENEKSDNLDLDESIENAMAQMSDSESASDQDLQNQNYINNQELENLSLDDTIPSDYFADDKAGSETDNESDNNATGNGLVEAGSDSTIGEGLEAESEGPSVSDDPNKMMSPDDIAALLASMGADGDEENSGSEDAEAEEPELSDDPNKMMSPDDIAALLASMGADGDEENSGSEDAESEGPELSDDPNKMMSPDDIEALFASMGTDGDEENNGSEDAESEGPELSDDPNKMMSPDDIAALLASMGADGDEENSGSEDAESEGPELSDDPNKMMSPDDIEALLASMGADEDSNNSDADSNISDTDNNDLNADSNDSNEVGDVNEFSGSMPYSDELDSDFSEEDIEAMLRMAENVDDANALDDIDDNADVTELLNNISDSGNSEYDELNELLGNSDNNVIVDSSYMDKLDKAERDGDSEASDDDSEDGNGKKKKKNKKKLDVKGLFSNLFGKKNKKDKSEVEDALGDLDSDDTNKKDNSEKANAAKDDNIMSSDDADVADDGALSLEAILAGDAEVVEVADPFGSADDGGTGSGSASGDSGKSDAGKNSADNANDNKKEKKKGFLAKIIELLTESDEDEDDIPEKKDTKLSDENLDILTELENEKGGKKKGKKEKPKKEKKEKKAKEKKAKPEKQKKVKLAEPEEKTKAVPKKYVFASIALCASILAILLIITMYVPKLMVLGSARDAFYNKDYKSAFLSMYGKDLNESDKLIYNRSKLIILLERKYESFENYMLLNMPVEGLDALLSGLKRYDELHDEAEVLNVLDELDMTKDKILKALYDNYGLSESEAYEVLGYAPIDYTLKIQSVVNGTPFEHMSDIINSQYGINTGDTFDLNELGEYSEQSGNSDGFVNSDYEDMLPEEIDYQNNNSEGNGDYNSSNSEGDNPTENTTDNANPVDTTDGRIFQGSAEDNATIIIESEQF